MGRIVKYIGVWLIAAVIGFIVVEIGYRVRLVIQNPFLLRSAQADEPVSPLVPIFAHTRSFWRFSATEGYELVPRDNLYRVSIVGDQISNCQLVEQLNKYGEPGLAEGNYDDAQVKIALFGNSFSMNTDQEGLTWVNHLQRRLAASLHQSVYIHNFARDGMGLIQMFDVAASVAPRYKPDLVIIAFVTERSPRRWRTETTINGEPHVLSMLTPTPNPTTIPPGAFDTFLVDSRITGEWCKAHEKGGPLDAVAKEVVGRYMRYRPQAHHHETVFSLGHSYLWNRIVHKNPFYNFYLDIQMLVNSDPQLTAADFANDPKLAASIKALQQTGIPYLVVHLPTLPEVKPEKEYSDPLVEEIAREVARRTGKPVYGLLDFMHLPVENADRMTVNDTDLHPSRFGMILYSDAVINLISKTRVLQAATPKS
jgi:hypothetical protein